MTCNSKIGTGFCSALSFIWLSGSFFIFGRYLGQVHFVFACKALLDSLISYAVSGECSNHGAGEKWVMGRICK